MMNLFVMNLPNQLSIILNLNLTIDLKKIYKY